MDSVLESTRAEEDKVKKETAEGLELFRKQQEEVDKKAKAAENDGSQIQEGSTAREDEWGATGRKRKRTKDKEVLKGVKVRRASSSAEQASSSSSKDLSTKSAKDESSSVAKSTKQPTPEDSAKVSDTEPKKVAPKPASAKTPPPPPPKKGLGLVDYGSDEDDY